MAPEYLFLGFSACLALAWSLINGMHRRSPERKRQVIEAAARFPPATRRKLLRLVAPTLLRDRVNHATVIAGCVCIIESPLVIALMILEFFPWWQPPMLAVAGALAGSYVGEFLFNSWGCAVVVPGDANPPRSESADARQRRDRKPL